MVKDVYDSIKLSVIERLSSPFFGVFVISWLLFNWKVIAYFFWGGDLTIQDRVEHYIQPLLDQSTFIVWFSIPDHILFPFIITVVFSFTYPFVSLIPFYVWQLSTSWKHRIRNVFESQELLTVEQSNALRSEMRQQQRLMNELVDESQKARVEAEERVTGLKQQLSDTMKLLEEEQEKNQRPIQGKATAAAYLDRAQKEIDANKKSSRLAEPLPPQKKNAPIKGQRGRVDIKPDGSYAVTSQKKDSAGTPVQKPVDTTVTVKYGKPNEP